MLSGIDNPSVGFSSVAFKFDCWRPRRGCQTARSLARLREIERARMCVRDGWASPWLELLARSACGFGSGLNRVVSALLLSNPGRVGLGRVAVDAVLVSPRDDRDVQRQSQASLQNASETGRGRQSPIARQPRARPASVACRYVLAAPGKPAKPAEAMPYSAPSRTTTAQKHGQGRASVQVDDRHGALARARLRRWRPARLRIRVHVGVPIRLSGWRWHLRRSVG